MNEPAAIANVVVIALTGLVSYAGFTKPYVIKQYLFDTRAILGGREYYRLLSSGVFIGRLDVDFAAVAGINPFSHLFPIL